MIVLPSVSSGVISSSLSKIFDPKKISGLVLWLKADAGVTLSGANVTAWADQSGNDNNFNGTAGFLTNALNGRPAINFNGIDTALTSPAGLLGGFSALSFIAVWNVESAQGNKGIFGSSNFSNLEVIADGNVIVRIRNNNYNAFFINGAGLTNLDEFALSYFDASNLTGSVFKNAMEAIETYISEIILTDAGTDTSNGTYTRGSGGTAAFSGPDGNEIYWDGTWYLYDADLEDVSYYNEEFDFNSGWQLNYGVQDAPTAAYTTTVGSIGNQSAVQMPLASNITYELGRYAYPDYQNLYASFQLAELIIYNSKLTTPQRKQVEAYLANKYAIPIPNAENMFLPQLWLKPDAGLNFNGADEVTEWTDQSSSGNNFLQDLDYIAYVENNIINGYRAVLFDGGRLNGDSDIVTGKTIYAVVKALGTQPEANAAIFECTGGSLYSAISDTEWGSYFYGSYSSNNSLAINTPAIIATLSDDGETFEYRKNGALQLDGSGGGGFYSRSASYLGNDSTGGQPANVYISEIIVYDRVLTTQERQQVEAYLNSKYAIY